MNSDINLNRVESQVRRGRPKIPPKWSRIIDLQAAEGYIIEIFDIDKDKSNVKEE